MTEHSQELEIRREARTVDLRDAATDSWTDVLTDVVNLSRGIAATEFVPTGLRGSTEKVTAAILYGRELGLPPMTALGSTHVIEGKAGISAELMRALILQAGHELVVTEQTAHTCTIEGRRHGSDRWSKATFTLAEAAQIRFKAKDGWKPLTTKANWINYPADMLLARATTRLARMAFADVIHGMRSAEELADQVDTVEAEVIDQPATVSRRRPAKSAPAPVAEETPETVRRSAPLPAPKPAPEPAQAPAGDVAPVARERLRPPTPAPKTPTSPAAPEPAQDPEPVEAELVPDDQPADEPPAVSPVTHSDPDTRPVSQRLLAVVQQHMKRLGVEDRDERLWWIAQIAGRSEALTTSKDLTHAEGQAVARALERLKSRESLEALGEQLRAGEADS